MIVLFYDRAARMMLQPISDAASRAADWQLEEWRLGDSAARLEELLALAVVIVAPGLPLGAGLAGGAGCCGTTVSSFGIACGYFVTDIL